MKKDEIDDRLMDALLRGKSDENLAEGLGAAESAKVGKGNFVRVVLAMAAMVLFAAIGILASKKSRSIAVEPDVVVIAAQNTESGRESQALGNGLGVGSSLAENVEEEIPQRQGKTQLVQVGRNQTSAKNSVNVVGSVNTPGAVVLEGELVLGDAFAQAGGPNTFGTTKRVAVYREGKKYLLDLSNENNFNEKLYPGDVVEVDQVKVWESGGSNASSKPKVPGSSIASVVTEFGDGDDFGAGWGGGGEGGGGGFFGRAPSLRSLHREEGFVAKNSEKYGALTDQPWKSPRKEALSTFSVDVDTASYTNLRRMINDGVAVPKDAVRIEELVNYFDYSYPQPEEGKAFGVGLAMASCPWEPKHNLVRVALQGKEVKAEERGDANLVFLVDVSGSMRDSDKLPLLVKSLGLLVEELREEDRVAIVVYAGSKGLALEPTKMGQGGREKVAAALGDLSAGGSTNGGAGIELAYRLAKKNFVKGGVNRVILATDGDFNVGTTSRDALVALVKDEAKDGVFLSVCGFGRGNLNDSMLEAITNDGNGVYYYIDSLAEGRRVFLEKLGGTLVTIAKDVKIQVEFNPAKVGQYRLIGYANRVLKKEDFNNDQVDAGDIGSGHQVTAFYEIIPVGVTGTVRPEVDDLKYQEEAEVASENDSLDWMTVKLRHKEPEGAVSELQEFVLQGEAKPWAEMDGDYQFASGVALWGVIMRGVVEPAEQKMVLELIRGAIVSGYESAAVEELLELFGKQAKARGE